MKALENIRIGKRLGILLSITVAQALILSSLGIWAVAEMNESRKSAEREGEMMALAERVSANQGAIAQRIATMALSPHLLSDLLGQLLQFRKEYMGAFETLQKMEHSEEGLRRLRVADQAAATWRDADNRLIAFLKAGKRAEAARLHEQEVITAFNQLGTTIGAYVTHRKERLAEINQQTQALITRVNVILIGVGSCLSILAIGLGIQITRTISKPLQVAVSQLREIAAGSISRDVPEEQLRRQDEFGDISQATQAMTASLRTIISEIAGGIRVLSNSSSALSSNSANMLSGSREASERAHAVAAASEQMSSNATSVAVGMEQTSANLTGVSSSTEQMTLTINEIARNSERARSITHEATRQAVRVTSEMQQLGDAAREIGKVTETITEISSQTNLLALNATIEAARAGASGKGFAVVANEIKELAQQTAAATEDIKNRIESVQSSTSSGIAEIERVSEVIQEVSDLVTSIAGAIEQQATVTKDIARNISEASTGVADANGRVAQTSQASLEIAREIAGVDSAARYMTEGSEQVRANADELSTLADQLKSAVARFEV